MKVKKYKREDEQTYALGMTITMEMLLTSPKVVERVYLKSDIIENNNTEKLKKLCVDNSIELIYSDKPFATLSQKDNCYVIGVVKKWKSELESGNHIVLVNPQDSGNLGNIIRSATALGFYDIAVIKPAVDVFDPKTIRASMGALVHIRCEYFESIESYVDRFKENNLYAFMLTSSEPLNEVEFKEPYSLVFGNEASGLDERFATFSKTVKIPQTDKVDSLNLTIATSIAMYEAKFARKSGK